MPCDTIYPDRATKSPGLSFGTHFFMNSTYSFTSGSSAHAGSPACLVNCVEVMTCAFSKPAGSSTVLTELVGLARNCKGVQFVSFTLRRPCAVNFGVEKYSRTSAP